MNIEVDDEELIYFQNNLQHQCNIPRITAESSVYSGSTIEQVLAQPHAKFLPWQASVFIVSTVKYLCCEIQLSPHELQRNT